MLYYSFLQTLKNHSENKSMKLHKALAWELVVQALEKRYEAFIFSKYMYKKCIYSCIKSINTRKLLIENVYRQSSEVSMNSTLFSFIFAGLNFRENVLGTFCKSYIIYFAVRKKIVFAAK